MDHQTSDSQKLIKVFDASKRKRTRKKREGAEENSTTVATDEEACAPSVQRTISGKTNLQNEMPENCTEHVHKDSGTRRDVLSLALKDGMVSTPRSVTPSPDGKVEGEAPTQDQDSLIYAFLEETIKRDKKKQQRHSRRHEDHSEHGSRERARDGSVAHDHRHRHRRRRDHTVKEKDNHHKEDSPSPAPVNTENVLLETFAKLCAQMNDNCKNNKKDTVQRTLSHKSLQCCEVASRRELDNGRHPVCAPSHDSRVITTPPPVRSQGNCRRHSRDKLRPDRCPCHYEDKTEYEKEKYIGRIDYDRKYSSKVDVNQSRIVNRTHEDERYRYPTPDKVATRTCLGSYRDKRDRECREVERTHYEDDRHRRYIEQKTSRSFDVQRDGYDEERYRRTSRSDTKDKRYDDKYYEKTPEVSRHCPKEKTRRHADRYDRNSVASREEEYRERDRYSERERDSGLSVADETSTMSGRTGRTHYMRAVKQEIAEQREAMDKMMKLWKELMRCFKGISQNQDKDKTANESACENVRETAASQFRLWRECMRRYETVARDVGDTDARLMEEINKQRSEMSEMATMWQECLQRYRDMSNDFNSLKQQLATAESPTRLPASASGAVPAACAEGEGPPPAPLYRLPNNYSQVGPPPSVYPGSALHGRASAPPAWWWGEHPPGRLRERRSSPDSRDGRDRDRDRDRDRERDRERDTERRHTHRHKDSRGSPRYKEKSSKPSAARSEHRRRKR